MGGDIEVRLADVGERCGPYAESYALFAADCGLTARVDSETFHPDTVRMTFALARDGEERIPPLSFVVDPAARATMGLPMILAGMQIVAIMAEGTLGGATDPAEDGGTERAVRTRLGLEGCRTALREILGERYLRLLAVGAGPEICDEFDAGRPGGTGGVRDA